MGNKVLIISNANELVRVKPERVVYVLSKDAETFIRIGKQLIINREYIFKINVNKQTLIMADMALHHVFSLTASKEALRQLKTYMESRTGKEVNYEG